MTCACGGDVREVRGPGRTFEYAKGVVVDVPADTLTVMCASCGSYHLGPESDALERDLAPLYLAKLEAMRSDLEKQVTLCDARLRIQFALLQEQRPDTSRLAPELVAFIEQTRVAPLTRTRALLLLAHLDAVGIKAECSDSISGGIRLEIALDSHFVTWFVYPSEMSWPGVHVLRCASTESGRLESQSFFNAHTLMRDLDTLRSA